MNRPQLTARFLWDVLVDTGVHWARVVYTLVGSSCQGLRTMCSVHIINLFYFICIRDSNFFFNSIRLGKKLRDFDDSFQAHCSQFSRMSPLLGVFAMEFHGYQFCTN